MWQNETKRKQKQYIDLNKMRILCLQTHKTSSLENVQKNNNIYIKLHYLRIRCLQTLCLWQAVSRMCKKNKKQRQCIKFQYKKIKISIKLINLQLKQYDIYSVVLVILCCLKNVWICLVKKKKKKSPCTEYGLWEEVITEFLTSL